MRTQTESKMRSTRIGQTKLKKCMKWTASGLLLAVMFVLVFAGTLSGAFGIENSLKQNGIIENNVASAAWEEGFYGRNPDTSNTTLLYDSSKGLHYGTEYLNRTITLYENEVNGHAVISYFNAGTKGKSGARIYASGNSMIYIGWEIKFDGAMKYAIMNGAISQLDFKLDYFSPRSGDGQNFKIWKGSTEIGSNSVSPNGTGNNSGVLAVSLKDENGDISKTDFSYKIEHGMGGDWGGTVDTYLHSAWVDIYKTDRERPYVVSDEDGNITFKDDGAGVWKVTDNGVDITNQLTNWSSDRREAHYTVTSGRHSFVVTDNVGNISEEYKYNMLEMDSDGSYLLRCREDFDYLSAFVARGNDCSGRRYKIVPDTSIAGQDGSTIIMGDTVFTPIGNSTTKFAGTVIGNGCTISGLYVNVAGDYVGLFGYTSGATIQHLTISGSVKGSKYVGGVVGYALNTTIYNVTNNATVTARYSTDNDLSTSIKQYDGGNVSSQGFDKVFDGKVGNDYKFCGKENSAMSFVADLGSKVAVSGFAIYNGNDTASYSNRRPKVVRIWGSNSKGSWPSKIITTTQAQVIRLKGKRIQAIGKSFSTVATSTFLSITTNDTNMLLQIIKLTSINTTGFILQA